MLAPSSRMVSVVAVICAMTATASAQFVNIPTAGPGNIVKAIETIQALETNLKAEVKVEKKVAMPVSALGLDASGTYLAMARADGGLSLWNLKQGMEIKELQQDAGALSQLAVTGDALIGALGASGQLDIRDGLSGKKLGGYTGVASVSVGSDGKSLLIASADNSLKVWNKAKKEVGSYPGAGGKVTAAALSADGKKLYAGTEQGKFLVWDVGAKRPPLSKKGLNKKITAMTFTSDGSGVVAVTEDMAALFKLGTGDKVKEVALPSGTKSSISNSGQYVAVLNGAGAIEVADFLNEGSSAGTITPSSGAKSIQFAPGDSHVFVSDDDNVVKVYKVADGSNVAQLITTKNGWMVVGPDGRYNGEGKGLDAVNFESEEKGKFGVDQFANTHYEPGLLPSVLEGQEIATEAKDVAKTGFAPPPSVRIITEESQTDKSVIEVAVEATDDGGGVEEIRLYHNGKLLDAKTRAVGDVVKEGTPARRVQTFQIPVSEGENVFRAVALSVDKVESQPDSTKVVVEGEKQTSTMHLLVVAINAYKNPALNLNYGVNDGQGIANFFAAQGQQLYADFKQVTLFDKQATKENIIEAMEAMKDIPPGDVAVIYLAGHGESDQNKWYFVPHELVYPDKPEHLAEKGLSSTELQDLVAKVGAGKVIMVMDACKSGAALVSFRGFEERKALRQLARANGVHVVAAAGKDQLASELAALGHGAFTHTMLQGLKGGADGSPKNGIVSVRELLSYVEEKLPEISEQQNLQAQFPVVDSRGQDFPIAVAEGSK